MTEAQKESLMFYAINDYLLINGILWGENEAAIDAVIRIINEDGRGVMKEALEAGFDVRWSCSKDEGERLYKVYQKRFPILDNADTKREIIDRANHDIANMMECLEPLADELTLFRNIKNRFMNEVEEGKPLRYLGFSSCSLNPHVAEQAMYGTSACTLCEITAPAGTPAIRLDLMREVQNEPDEVILPPMEFLVTKMDQDKHKIYMTCVELLKIKDEITSDSSS